MFEPNIRYVISEMIQYSYTHRRHKNHGLYRVFHDFRA